MSISITETPNCFEVRFSYNPIIVESLKSIPGRRYHYSEKMWTLPLDARPAVEEFRRRYRLDKIDKRAEVYEEPPELPELSEDMYAKLKSLIKRTDGKFPFPYQLKGVAQALHFKKLIIGDEPGLGKTMQALFTVLLAEQLPLLIICPSSLKYNWQREIKQWTGMDAMILSDRTKRTWSEFARVGAKKIFIVNYESLKKYFVAEIKKPEGAPLRANHIHYHQTINLFKAVIIDESHRCKETKAQQSKFTYGICKGKEMVLALTGTPVVNKPRDLASQLSIIDQIHNFGNYKAFMNRYCEGYNGASNLKELGYLLRKYCFYRREKKDVLTELPDKMRQIVLCDISTRTEYTAALADLENYLRQYRQATDEKVASALRGEVMVRIGVLKNISARGKLNDVIDTIREVIGQGEKIGVFVHLKEVAQALLAAFPGALHILGDDPTNLRQHHVDQFQTYEQHKLIICSIKAAGVGITLTAASRMAFVELPWHPADCDQCEDRFHRIGQRDSVQCMYFLGKETIDEYIYSIIEKKRSMSTDITGATSSIEAEVIDMMTSSLFNSKNTNDRNTISGSDNSSQGAGPEDDDQHSEAASSEGNGSYVEDPSEGLFPNTEGFAHMEAGAGGSQESREGF